MINNIIYSLKIWLTSVVVSPSFYLLFNYVTKKENIFHATSSSFLYMVFVMFGLFFSFITWFVFLLLILSVVKHAPTEIIARSLISIIGILLTLGTFAAISTPIELINDADNKSVIPLILANCFCIGAGSWIYDLTLLKSANPTKQLIT